MHCVVTCWLACQHEVVVVQVLFRCVESGFHQGLLSTQADLEFATLSVFRASVASVKTLFQTIRERLLKKQASTVQECIMCCLLLQGLALSSLVTSLAKSPD